MTVSQPGYHAALVTPDGRLTKPLINLLQALASAVNADSSTDLSAVLERIAALEGLRIVGLNGVSVFGDAEGGFSISASGVTDPLVAQIFGQ